eukprot:SAG31_NODE_1903_length_6956_cov_3.288902_10_plen_53_part_00
MAAGAVWNLGNVASIFATNAIGYAVACETCALLVILPSLPTEFHLTYPVAII